MSGTVHLSANHVIYSFSPEQPPAIAVPSGSTLVVETRDAYDRRFRRDLDVESFLRERAKGLSNPATGPVYVQGLRPDDGLDVTIERIDLAGRGYVAAYPGIGVLGKSEIIPRVSVFEVRGGDLWYEGRLRLPLRPMVGVIGVAPASGAVPCLGLGYHGGNLDCNQIAEGTVCHFPVAVEGGLLAIGDVHAAMGYCELHSGVNIDATVRLRVERVQSPGWQRPWFETAGEVMTVGVEDRLEDAICEATRGMVELLQARLGVTYTEAVILAGAAVDIRLGQAAGFGVKVSAYAACSKMVLGGAGHSPAQPRPE